jgi:membrane protein involved in colicin uptake
MNKKTVFIKTPQGERETPNLTGDLKRVMALIDNKSTVDEIFRRAPPSLREDLNDVLEELLEAEYIRDRDQVKAEPKIVAPKVTAPKMFVPKAPAAPSGGGGELDFTHMPSSVGAKTMGKEDEDALAKAELEIAMAQSGVKMQPKNEESEQARLKAKIAAAEKARSSLEAGIDAAKERANAEAKAKADAKAKQEAELAARAKAAADLRATQEAALREQTQAKAKLEAAARQRAEQEAARAKAAEQAAAKIKAEAEAKVRAEIEAAARAKQIAEAKAKQEAEEARIRAEVEARLKAEAEAKARAEAEAKARAEAEAKARAEAEAKARAEAEAKARAEAEAKARAEAEAKARAEAEAKARAEAEAKARAEAEAKARAEAEAKARAEAEAKARAEAEAKARAEAEAKARAEAEARARAEAEAEARIRAETEARVRAEAEAAARVAATPPQSAGAPAFKLDLDHFMATVPAAEPPRMEPAPHVPQESVEEQKSPAVQENKAAAKQDMVSEMARLKAEADAARLKAEEEARLRMEEAALAEAQAKAWAEAEQRAQAQARAEAEQMAQQAALSQAKAATKSAPRTRRALPWGKIVAALVVLALIAVVVLPYVYPLQEYIAPLEQRLANQLKQPVKIGGMSAGSLPPRLRLQSVAVGAEQEMKAGEIVLNLDLIPLFTGKLAVSEAEVNGLDVKGSQMERLAPSLRRLTDDKEVPIQHVTLRNVKIATDELAVPALSGVVERDAQGALTHLALHTGDDKYSMDLTSDQGRWKFSLGLRETALPWMPDIVFSDLEASGVWGDGEINFNEINAHIYKGILLGNAKLNWRNKGWQLQGRLEAKTFELDKMLSKYGVEGEMNGEGSFTMSAAKLSMLGETPKLEGAFSVKNGNLIGVDMPETARLVSREHLVGGRTRFDDMIGTVLVDNHATKLRQLKIMSNQLTATGSCEVNAAGQISGNFNAEIRVRSGNTGLVLSGAPGTPKLVAR